MSKLNKLYHNLTNVSFLFLFLFFFVFNTFLFAQNINNQITTIVIDPGHGGKDPGTMGTKRYTKYEKDVALSVALKLGDYISNTFKDIEIIYTRKKDYFVKHYNSFV